MNKLFTDSPRSRSSFCDGSLGCCFHCQRAAHCHLINRLIDFMEKKGARVFSHGDELANYKDKCASKSHLPYIYLSTDDGQTPPNTTTDTTTFLPFICFFSRLFLVLIMVQISSFYQSNQIKSHSPHLAWGGVLLESGNVTWSGVAKQSELGFLQLQDVCVRCPRPLRGFKKQYKYI
jgi:hypothetical protein